MVKPMILNEFNLYDDNKTAKNADAFLKNIKRIARLAGQNPTALKSPNLSGVAVTHSFENTFENQVIDHVSAVETAPKIFNDTYFALSCVSERSRKILLGSYIDGLTDEIMANRIGYSKSSYRKFKKVALNEFADAMSSHKTILNIDLHETSGDLV